MYKILAIPDQTTGPNWQTIFLRKPMVIAGNHRGSHRGNHRDNHRGNHRGNPRGNHRGNIGNNFNFLKTSTGYAEHIS